MNPSIVGNNQIETGGTATPDADIIRYQRLPLDADPVRETKTSATDAEKDAAMAVIQKIRDFLSEHQIESILADSGNGGHCLLCIDLSVEDKPLVEDLIRSFSAVFSTPEVLIDTSVSNPSRIWKLYGTVSRKGENTPDRPWRVSKLLDVPEGIQNRPIDRDRLLSLLKELQSLAPTGTEPIKKPADVSSTGAKILYGEHAYELNRIAGKLRGIGLEEEAIYTAIVEVCEKRCVDYGSDYVDMCRRIAHKICRKDVGKDDTVLHNGVPAGTAVGTTEMLEALAERDRKETKTKASFNLDGFRIDGNTDKNEPLKYVFENFIEECGRVAMIGGEKAEKSIFTMRLWMHGCCGKTWCGYHCPRALRVVYFDAELTKEQLDSRHAKLMMEFTPEEQEMIRKNFDLICLKKFTTETDTSVEFTNDVFWATQTERYGDRDVAVFDSLYMYYDESARNRTAEQAKAVKAFERFFKKSVTYVVMHTRKRENKDIKAGKGLALRFVSIRPWSDQASGGGTIKKYASTIIGLDRFEELDDEGGVEYQAIDLKFYHRSGGDSPLMTFEIDDRDDGNDLRRRLIRSLGPKAMSIYLQLKKAVGPWSSRYQAAKALSCVLSKVYPRLDELISKEYLVVDPVTKRISLSGMTQDIERELTAAREKEIKKEAAKTWLASFLPGPPRYDLILVSEIRAEAKKLSLEWLDIKEAKKVLDIKEQLDLNGGKCWHHKRPRLYTKTTGATGANPKITDGLTSKTGENTRNAQNAQPQNNEEIVL